jgi:hypothetical protein
MAKSKHKGQTKSHAPSTNTATNHTEVNAPTNVNLTVNTPASNTPAANTPPSPAPVNNSSTPIIVALIGGAVTILTAIIALFQNPQILTSIQNRIMPPTPVVATATPVPFARIQSLEVIQGETVVQNVDPDGSFSLPTGSSVNLRVNVISNTDIKDLLFLWEFCDSVNDAKGQGAIEIPYRFRAKGQDCITVKIQGGSGFLDKADFFVSP